MLSWSTTLDQVALDEAARVAKARNSTNRTASNPDGAIIASHKADYLGAIGELAVSKLMRLDWCGQHFEYEDWLKYRRGGTDVGGFEVKCSDHPKGRLWARRGYEVYEDRPYVFVRALLPVVTLMGWAYGKEIAKPENLEPGKYNKPCYYLATSKLRDMATLSKI